MHVNLIIFYTLGLSVGCFHLPKLDVNSNTEVDSSQSNTGLIHSFILNNWSQSLNIGSVSIADTIIILFVALCMHLRTTERLNHLSKIVECCQRSIRRLARNKSRRQPNFKPNSVSQAEAEIWRGKSSCVLCQCDSLPVDCLCDDLQISIQFNSDVIPFSQGIPAVRLTRNN